MGDEEVAATVNELQTQMTAIQAASEGNAQSGLFRQAPFCGGPNENVNEWLTKFERLSKFYNWSNAKKLGALPLLFGGTALAWFQTLPDETINDYATLIDELKTRFGAQNLEFIFRQELYARRQGQNEPLSMYTEDVIRKCQRLSLSDNDMMNVFINGLNNEIKTHVILNQPKSFAEAENLARLRHAVANSTGFSNSATATAQSASQEQKIKELEGQVNLLMTLAAQKKDPSFSAKPVQAFEAKTPLVVKNHTNPFLPFSSVPHQSECGSEIASAKQEIIAAFETRFQGNQVPKGQGLALSVKRLNIECDNNHVHYSHVHVTMCTAKSRVHREAKVLQHWGGGRFSPPPNTLLYIARKRPILQPPNLVTFSQI